MLHNKQKQHMHVLRLILLTHFPKRNLTESEILPWLPALVLQVSFLTLSSIYTPFNTLKNKCCRKTLWKNVKLLKMSIFTFSTMFSMQPVLKTPLIAKFQLSLVSLNLGQSKNGILGNGLVSNNLPKVEVNISSNNTDIKYQNFHITMRQQLQ